MICKPPADSPPTSTLSQQHQEPYQQLHNLQHPKKSHSIERMCKTSIFDTRSPRGAHVIASCRRSTFVEHVHSCKLYMTCTFYMNAFMQIVHDMYILHECTWVGAREFAWNERFHLHTSFTHAHVRLVTCLRFLRALVYGSFQGRCNKTAEVVQWLVSE